jgi:hypothetical protein
MRITNASGVRNDLLQEIANQTATPGAGNSAITLVSSINSIFFPHAASVRITYTVPANKQAIISSVWMKLVRVTVAGTGGIVLIRVFVTPSGGARTLMYATRLEAVNNAIGDKEELILPMIRLFDGDLIEFETSDTSITGSVLHQTGFNTSEFDD